MSQRAVEGIGSTTLSITGVADIRTDLSYAVAEDPTDAMFFIATADAHGQPDCSYKGGLPGFVRVLDDTTLAIPDYDGNGMYRTWGNVLVNPQVGLLFPDFEQPKRLRVNGTARIASQSAVQGVSTTSMNAIIRSWMLQPSGTMPALSKVTTRLTCRSLTLSSKRLVSEKE